jgi:hypothetical protein
MLLNPVKWFAVIAAALLAVAACPAQGTMTITFEGQPRGTTLGPIGIYIEQGMQFGMNYGPGSLILSGGGVAGYPDNGTGYLEIPDGIPGGSGDTRFEFGFNAFYPTNSLFSFNLVSLDAAEYDGAGPQTLTVVGYRAQIMGPTLTFTNTFSITSQTFQTCYLDSTFANVFKVDVFNARWSLDNLVISGVPEPSPAAITAAALCCVLAREWFSRRKKTCCRMPARRATTRQ